MQETAAVNTPGGEKHNKEEPINTMKGKNTLKYAALQETAGVNTHREKNTTNNKRPEVLYHPRHKLCCFCDHKYLKSRLVVAILNYSEITCTFQDVIVKCELFLTSIFEFLCSQKIMKFIHGGHFEFQ